MELRPARRDDILWLATLWAHAFPGEQNVAERARQLETGGPYGTIDCVRVAERAGRAIGACKLHRMRQRLAGTTLPMMGLAAVAIAPEHRRAGAGRELCRLALREAREQGNVVSVLFAFRPDYYRSLGWGLVGELHSYRFRPELLRADGSAPVRLAGPDDFGAIAACYDRMLATAHGPIERATPAWQHHFSMPCTYAYVLADGGDVRGYLLARYGTGASRDLRILHIRELVADDDDAYDALLSWIARQQDLWRQVVYDALPDELFAHRLADPRPPGHRPLRGLWDPTARVARGPMLRLLDVRAALEQRRLWGTTDPCAFVVEARDAELPDNGLPIRVEFDGERAVIDDDATGAPTRLVADIAALAQIYAGELSVSGACRLGSAEASGDLHALDRLFAPPASFRLLDEF